MTIYEVKMTGTRVPKYIVKNIDEARAIDSLGLSQWQMIANRGEPLEQNKRGKTDD
jgi:hypothetical protein